MSLILDAGALIAYERRDQSVRAYLERARRTETTVATTTAVVAQVWRKPAGQTLLSRLLRGVAQADLTGQRARSIGRLLGESASVDVIDASLVDLAEDGDEILTSDPQDIAALATTAGMTLIVTAI